MVRRTCAMQSSGVRAVKKFMSCTVRIVARESWVPPVAQCLRVWLNMIPRSQISQSSEPWTTTERMPCPGKRLRRFARCIFRAVSGDIAGKSSAGARLYKFTPCQGMGFNMHNRVTTVKIILTVRKPRAKFYSRQSRANLLNAGDLRR